MWKRIYIEYDFYDFKEKNHYKKEYFKTKYGICY